MLIFADDLVRGACAVRPGPVCVQGMFQLFTEVSQFVADTTAGPGIHHGKPFHASSPSGKLGIQNMSNFLAKSALSGIFQRLVSGRPTRMTRRSMTLVWVKPVRSKSPSGSKK